MPPVKQPKNRRPGGPVHDLGHYKSTTECPRIEVSSRARIRNELRSRRCFGSHQEHASERRNQASKNRSSASRIIFLARSYAVCSFWAFRCTSRNRCTLVLSTIPGFR